MSNQQLTELTEAVRQINNSISQIGELAEAVRQMTDRIAGLERSLVFYVSAATKLEVSPTATCVGFTQDEYGELREIRPPVRRRLHGSD